MFNNKYVLLGLVFLFCAANCAAEEMTLVGVDQIEFKKQNDDEIAYFKTGELFSGAVDIKDDKDLIFTYFYKNGLKDGIASANFANGKSAIQITYANGHKNGDEVAFYENGNVKYKRTFADDVLKGEEILFYENGKPERHAVYENGKFNGEVRYFDRDGNILKIENYLKGVKNGPERIVENNILREENNYSDGILDGVTKKYDEKYLTDEITYKSGRKEGKHTTYKSDGSKTEILYANDKKEGVAYSYYPDAKIADKTVYINDQKNGLTEKFSPNGILFSAEMYKNDKKNGISRYFADNADLQNVIYYENNVELAKIDLSANQELHQIYNAYKEGSLVKFSNNKNLWYSILWLGLNIPNNDILTQLEKDMRMYAYNIDDEDVYKKFTANYSEINKNLYFGLTPLSYAVNLAAKSEILHKFANQIDITNAKGTTVLQEAVRLNDKESVEYLLLQKAKLSGANENILLYALNNDAQDDIILLLVQAGAKVNVTDENNYTALSIAIQKQRGTIIKLLSEQGADLRYVLPSGQTMLFYAYENNATADIIKNMLDAGVDANQKDKGGKLLLVEALKDKNMSIIIDLLKHGADVNLTDSQGESALSYVLKKNVENDDIVQHIFAQPLEINEKLANFDVPLWRVLMQKKWLKQLKIVWDSMPDITVIPDKTGAVPFYEAIKQQDDILLQDLALSYVKKADDEMVFAAADMQNIGLFKKLLAKGANVNAINDKGNTLLIELILNKADIEFMNAIEDLDLDVNALNAEQKDALEIAIEQNNSMIVENLLQHGANVNRLLNNENYLMKLKPEQNEIGKLLMAAGADINYKTDKKQTVLMKAVVNLNDDMIDDLLSKKVDINENDEDGCSAFLYIKDAISANQQLPEEQLKDKVKNIFNKFIEYGQDINFQNSNGETLLILLAKAKISDYTFYKQMLVEAGINTNMKDQYGKIADDYIEE